MSHSYRSMYRSIFLGNRSAPKIVRHVYSYSQAYPRAQHGLSSISFFSLTSILPSLKLFHTLENRWHHHDPWDHWISFKHISHPFHFMVSIMHSLIENANHDE